MSAMETTDSNPIVTVIIPVYNTEPYLRKCLDSICGQTYRNLEIICVNDGSTDGSLAILEEYAARDARVKVLVQENAGQAAARNRALEIATGDWISCIDSDDWIDSNTYEELLKVIKPGTNIVCFNAQAEGGNDPERNRSVNEYYSVNFEGLQNISEQHISNTSAAVSTKLIRRKLVEEYGIRFPAGKKYEDAAFFFCIMMVAGQAYYVKHGNYYHYLQRAGSTMHASFDKDPIALNHLEICEHVYAFEKRHGITNKWEHVFAWIFHLSYNFASSYIPEDMRATLQAKAYHMARKWGLMRRHDLASIQAIRQHNRSCLEKIYHSCHPNRDSFGIGGCSILSIVHTRTEDVFYLCGKKLFTRKVQR